MRVQVRADHYSRLLQLAVTAGFDWVFYAAEDFVRMSVIPDGKPIIEIILFLHDYTLWMLVLVHMF